MESLYYHKFKTLIFYIFFKKRINVIQGGNWKKSITTCLGKDYSLFTLELVNWGLAENNLKPYLESVRYAYLG